MTKGLTISDEVPAFSSSADANPIKNEPTAFTIKVANGKGENRCPAARATAYLDTEPTAPPTATHKNEIMAILRSLIRDRVILYAVHAVRKRKTIQNLSMINHRSH